MSQGAPIQLATAEALFEQLVTLWELGPSVVVVGSVRRRRPEVHDLELLAPWEAPKHDTLCSRITRTMEPEIAGGLFGVPAERVVVSGYIGRIERGLKPGFLSASLILRPWAGVADPAWQSREVAVQVNRCHETNRGWTLLRCTGPAEFGRTFLWKWKQHWRIPDSQEASIDGHLVDARGAVIPTPTEEDAFKLCGMEPIAPELRDAYVARDKSVRAGGDKSTFFPD